MDANQPIYNNIDESVCPDSSGIYYKSMLADTLLDPGAEGEYEQTSTYMRVSGSCCKGQSVRVQHLKSLKIVLSVLCVLTLLSLIVAIVGVALASASWSSVLNQKCHANPSTKERIAKLSNLLNANVSELMKQDDILGQRLFQVSQIYENCHFEVSNCSSYLPLQYYVQAKSCVTNPVLPMHKEVSI